MFLYDPDRFVLVLLSPIIIASADSPCVSSILSSSHDSRVTLCLSFYLSVFACLCSGLTLSKFSSRSVQCFSKTAVSLSVSFSLSNVLITVLCLFKFICLSWSFPHKLHYYYNLIMPNCLQIISILLYLYLSVLLSTPPLSTYF